MHRRPRHPCLPGVLLLSGLVVASAVACAIAVRRDLSAVPAGQIGFDDMCGLQDYYDMIDSGSATAPIVVSALDLEGNSGNRAIQGGRMRVAFQSEFQLKHLRRVLDENWKRLPEQVAGASRIEIEVRWAEKAGVRRVVTNQEAELSVGRESWALPYHACLSEIIFGAPLYKQRREMWGLPLPGRPAKPGPAPGPGTDAGAGQ